MVLLFDSPSSQSGLATNIANQHQIEGNNRRSFRMHCEHERSCCQGPAPRLRGSGAWGASCAVLDAAIPTHQNKLFIVYV
jgi:hypothetical protein